MVKTGYGAVMRKVFDCPMPEFIGWDTDTLEKLEAARVRRPVRPAPLLFGGRQPDCRRGRRFRAEFAAWVETVKSLWPDFPVYGSMMECSECMTRLIGPQNHMLWMALEPERMGAVLNRVGQFYLDCAKAAIEAAGPWLDGFVIWGDVAYKKGTFMRPDYWRTYYKPWVKAIAEHCHGRGLEVIYHGCGNVGAIFEDYIEIGIDAYNPLEVKAGMDALDLRRRLASGSVSAATATFSFGSRATGRPSAATCCGSSMPARGRHDFPIGSFRVQCRFGADLRLHCETGAGVRAVSVAAGRPRRSGLRLPSGPRKKNRRRDHVPITGCKQKGKGEVKRTGVGIMRRSPGVSRREKGKREKGK